MRSKFYYSDKIIVVCVIILLALSNLMVYSTWSIRSVVYGDNSSASILIKQLIFTLLAIIVYILASSMPSSFYRRIAKLLWFISIGLLIVVFMFPAINESKSWIPLPFFNFQPSEFAKIAVILYLASYYHFLHTTKQINSLKNVLFFPSVIVLVPAVLIFLQPDPGTMVILLFISFMTVLSAKIPKRLIIKMVSTIVKFSLALFILLAGINLITGGAITSYVKTSQARALSRLDYKQPCDERDGKGFHICNSLIAINSGGIFGKGLGKSTQKYLYLPETHTDAIIAVTAEELGLVGITIILMCYFILIIRIMSYASKSLTYFGSITCVGIAFLYFTHVFINVGGIINLIPFTGVPLPFYSYGGTFLMLSSGALGIVQSIAIEVNRER